MCFLKKKFYKPTYTQTSGTNPKTNKNNIQQTVTQPRKWFVPFEK